MAGGVGLPVRGLSGPALRGPATVPWDGTKVMAVSLHGAADQLVEAEPVAHEADEGMRGDDSITFQDAPQGFSCPKVGAYVT